jgi:2-methylfumaryl-CoA isomerase
MATLPLAGLKVIEVSTYVAAPLGGMTLAQLGADVVRIDPIGGAPDTRRWPVAEESGVSLYWTGLNKGKRSMTLDLRSGEGQRLVAELLERNGPDGGIMLTNAAGRPWLGYDALRQVRPDLIHVQIQGLHDGTPAVDYTVNAGTGFPMVTGPEGHADPVNHVVPVWDIACGLYAALAIVSAERLRSRTGRGQPITIALGDVALAMAGNLGFLAEAQINNVVRRRIGNYLYGSFGRDFRCKDGAKVMVVALTQRHWVDLVSVTGQQEPVAALEKALDCDFTREADRYEYRVVLAGLFEHWFERQDRSAVHEALARTSLLWSPYESFADLVRPGSSLARNPLLSVLDQPGVGPHLAPGSPLRTEVAAPARPAPALGEHTIELLHNELSLDHDAIAALRRAGVIDAPMLGTEG